MTIVFLFYILDSSFQDPKPYPSSQLKDILINNNIKELYVAGLCIFDIILLAIEYGVQYTILDAKIMTSSTLYFIQDASLGISQDSATEIYKRFETENIAVVKSTSNHLARFKRNDVQFDSSIPMIRLTDFYNLDYYEICGPLDSNSSFYFDIDLEILSYPLFIDQCYYIKTYNGDRNITASRYLVADIDRSVKFFILWPSSSPPPDWIIQQFVNKKMSVKLSNNHILDVWESQDIYENGEEFVFSGPCDDPIIIPELSYVIMFQLSGKYH